MPHFPCCARLACSLHTCPALPLCQHASTYPYLLRDATNSRTHAHIRTQVHPPSLLPVRSVLMGANIAVDIAKGELSEATCGYNVLENARVLRVSGLKNHSAASGLGTLLS